MQTAALVALGLADQWTYDAMDVEPENFEARVRDLPGEGFVGVNVTIPHKEAALAAADQASRAAQEIGAANTLSFAHGAETGVPTIAAENTDADRQPGLGLHQGGGPSGEGQLPLLRPQR